jgi:hypothetical protein
MKKQAVIITGASSGHRQCTDRRFKHDKALLTFFGPPHGRQEKIKILETMKSTPQDPAAITEALENYYFKALYEGDVSALRKILNPGTLLFGDVKGQPYAKTLDVYLDAVKNRQSPKDSGKPFKGTIRSVEVINSIAIAKVNVKMYDFNYDEFLSFHKIDNRWMIVNKMISDVVD